MKHEFNKKIAALILLLSFALVAPATGGELGKLRARAVRFARNGEHDFAFMQYRTILERFPGSRYNEDALFVQGEYYFRLPQREKAGDIFLQLLQDYPESEGKLFALVYLLRIARLNQNTPLVEKWEKEIIDLQQVNLIFSKYKEYKYLSPLYHAYSAVFHIDKIEFFIDGTPFEKITY